MQGLRGILYYIRKASGIIAADLPGSEGTESFVTAS
jgi:hypothetical protein